MDNKAQGISVTTIIIAAIALVVLVVVIAIFTGYFAGFGGQVEDVTQTCSEFTSSSGEQGRWDDECGEDERSILGAKDAPSHPGMKCCVPED
ncbi:hypothetical protein GF336_07050 [Candidatus Woesearchaeota archaeon]|nr:hypothetical protein [Candidatus Woesearchaeota archaeon]